MAGSLGNFPFTEIRCGEVSGSTTAKQLPDVVSAGLVYIQAVKNNAAAVTIGGAGVTIQTGTTNTTTGVALEAGEWMPAVNIDNLNRLYIIGANATDDIVYFIMR
jgi:hypothetical protein